MLAMMKKVVLRVCKPTVCLIIGLLVAIFLLKYAVYKLSIINDANDYAEKVDFNSFPLIAKSNNSNTKPKQQALLTLFTTFKDIPGRIEINKLTIDTWSSLPRVVLVMFTETDNSTVLSRHAVKRGWHVHKASNLRNGYPVLKDMFLFVKRRIYPQTNFVAYANSDIVFTVDLIDTLKPLSRIDPQYFKETGLLISGLFCA